MLPWFERLRDEVPDLEPLDAHTHIGSNDPDGFTCTRAAAGRRRSSGSTRARSSSRCTSRTATRAANDMVHRRGRARRTGGCSRSAGSTRTDDPLAEAERALDRRRARDQAAPARRAASRSTTPGSQPVFALADERRLPVLVHAGRGIPALGRHAVEATGRHPGHAPDPRPRRHLRPRLDLARGARPPQPLLRHLLVVARGPPGAVRARAARPDPDGERRALRLADLGHRHGRCATRCRSGSTPTRLAACWAARRFGW